MSLTPLDIAALLVLGLAAGTLGGMIGIGGSIVMIPVMAIMFDRRDFGSQHLYQAAAMVVNVAVAIPASIRHRRAGTVRPDIFWTMLWPTLIAIVAGVLLSNLLDTRVLRTVFAVFLLYIVADNALKIVHRSPDHAESEMRITRPRLILAGSVMGLVGGLLGVGGGGVAVPMLLLLCRTPLRHAIGVAAAIMVITAALGATLKIATISQHDIPWFHPLIIASCLVPTALLGGRLGASLTHRAPLAWVRAVFVISMLIIALRMAMG